MRAILLSAGQGTRLLPLTLHIPKCLVEINDHAILDHQIDALQQAGIEEIVVVGGYLSEQIRDHLARSTFSAAVRLVINPFWSVASSISSVWAARDYLDDPFCLLNGDTIFDSSVIEQARRDALPGVNLIVEPVSMLESDDMRVQVRGRQILAVGKKLPQSITTHRSLGMVLCPDRPGGAYRKALQAVIEESEGYNAYHHAVIDRLAHTVGVTAIENSAGLWCEVDRPEDIERWTRDHRPRPWPRALP